MRTAALFTGLALAVLASTTARAGAPYPPSTIGISWDTSTYSYGGIGGDIWPISWAQDGTLRAAYGDGQIGCAVKVSYGVISIASPTPSTSMQSTGCGPSGVNKGKFRAMVAAGADLYAVVNPQSTGTGYRVWRSPDGGQSWQKPNWSFSSVPDAFVQFGRANADAPDGYVYLVDSRSTGLHLMRVPPASVQTQSAYQYWTGSAWSTSSGASRPIFTDPAGIERPNVVYHRGLNRFLLTAAHTKPGQFGVFEAPALTGPWRTVYYSETWLGLGTQGSFLGLNFPIKWQSTDGRTLWATFSCHNAGATGACKIYHDRFNLMKATLTIGGAGT